MKPCDCHDNHTVRNKLNEAGIKFNDIGIEVRPSIVFLTVGSCTLKINQKHFERLARWYLEDQE